MGGGDITVARGAESRGCGALFAPQREASRKSFMHVHLREVKLVFSNLEIRSQYHGGAQAAGRVSVV